MELTAKKRQYRKPLTSLKHVRKGMARTIRDLELGLTDATTARALCSLYVEYGKMLQQTELENRMAAIEDAIHAEAAKEYIAERLGKELQPLELQG